MFLIGAVYEITYNDPTKQGKFAHSQLALLLDLPLQEDLNRFKKIPVYIPPPGIKTVVYDSNKPTQGVHTNLFSIPEFIRIKQCMSTHKGNVNVSELLAPEKPLKGSQAYKYAR